MSRCQSCGARLLQRGGFIGSGLCGACCLGEADAAQDITTPCPVCKVDLQHHYTKPAPTCAECSKTKTGAQS